MDRSARAYLIDLSPTPLFEPLTLVRLRRSVLTDDGIEVSIGTTGAVVAVWAEGAAYEVEFVPPHDGTATIAADDLEAVQDHE